MYIVTSAKIRQDLQKALLDRFPNDNFYFHENINEAQTNLKNAEILITLGEDLSREHIEEAVHLEWIMVISAGMDRMPFHAIKEKGILVTNARGIHKTPMAEYTMGMILQTARQAKILIKHQEQGIWDRSVAMSEISGRTIGILGTGAIGSEIARLAKAFGMTTLGFNRSGEHAEYVDRMYSKGEELASVLKESDYLVSVLPTTEETKGFLSLEHFRRMKKSAVFLNIGRGTTVVQDDLISALRQGEIAHAVLDVFEEEPLPANNPLWNMKNVTITPHISGISPLYQDRAIQLFAENLEKYKKKDPLLANIIAVERGY
ncbi:Phosphoglycerate dehydrogenase [Fictibacillus enclensis]|uniref:3-phosphoglycerate dehydrogenase n=1 Tax=Fictibacillus enclensis TaxID=1017270 RepID=A0A0V8J274_9BACL|nr:D-2-hydroxyacid dehydrogenase [Fictibacillus enclensis]KSU80848.1 3-phosphoglycerate dehydrogenase [Fictibacillus enclensis]SCC32012.1 Phosphoglycerate dehydrogenase [Fictibacillus enclensis]